jgi:hypothetical protein
MWQSIQRRSKAVPDGFARRANTRIEETNFENMQMQTARMDPVAIFKGI